jgi:hypothetical protein
MVGITLSAEQIQQAPLEVRRWLEQQISSSLGLYRPDPTLRAPQRHLVGCDVETARTILSMINGLLPVVNVFFELGRDPIATSPQGLRALSLGDMARHARLQPAEQVTGCLKVIDEAMQRASNAPDAMLTALDGEGHCLVADVTARSILALWQEIVASHNPRHPDYAPIQATPYTGAMPPQAPYSMSAPPFSTDAQPDKSPG